MVTLVVRHHMESRRITLNTNDNLSPSPGQVTGPGLSYMKVSSLPDVKKHVLQHPRIVYRLPPHFHTVHLNTSHATSTLGGADSAIQELIRLALGRLSGRIFVEMRHRVELLGLGFEDPADLTFFVLMLPPPWQVK